MHACRQASRMFFSQGSGRSCSTTCEHTMTSLGFPRFRSGRPSIWPSYFLLDRLWVWGGRVVRGSWGTLCGWSLRVGTEALFPKTFRMRHCGVPGHRVQCLLGSAGSGPCARGPQGLCLGPVLLTRPCGSQSEQVSEGGHNVYQGVVDLGNIGEYREMIGNIGECRGLLGNVREYWGMLIEKWGQQASRTSPFLMCQS